VRISIIIPALNEAPNLGATIAACRSALVSEVIVVDGGSTDDSAAIARRYADRVIDGERGRAVQMNAGAAVASGDVLLFLHGDTLLPPGFARAIRDALADETVIGGRFDLALEPSSPLLWLTATLINLRSRLSGIATGDQALFVRRRAFDELGGYEPIPLMEDLALSIAMKRRGGIARLRQRVVTSSRRWRRNGVVRTILLMWSLRFLYFCGVSPDRLHKLYADAR
jgi:rSAM/selenodomain-associated transferase 2